jgi:hypothetical protein
MAQVKTMTVTMRDSGSKVVINATDFDPDLHALEGDLPTSAPKQAAPEEPKVEEPKAEEPEVEEAPVRRRRRR